uniref:UBFD1 PH-like C-terminal domain-containing protein n=1 Tax=Otolemur garnettii TaxID=30611 RepID=H0Y1A6_OTOGA
HGSRQGPVGMEEPDMDPKAEKTEGPILCLDSLEAKNPACTATEVPLPALGIPQPALGQPWGLGSQQSRGRRRCKGAGGLEIIWNKTKHDVEFPVRQQRELKQKIHSIIGLPPAMQSVRNKGLTTEDKTLGEIKVTSGPKIMVVGSVTNDVLAVNVPKDAGQQDAKTEENKKDPLCKQKQHRKVSDKGKPEDVMPSVKRAQELLSLEPLSDTYKSRGKVKHTFKLKQEQLWMGTEETEKLPMGSIKNVDVNTVEGHGGYHMMAFHGPHGSSYYWVYWAPQYVDAIKDTMLGKWQYF